MKKSNSKLTKQEKLVLNSQKENIIATKERLLEALNKINSDLAETNNLLSIIEKVIS